MSTDSALQLALLAVEGGDANDLPETEREHAAKAIECGYLYREGDMLYTKILVCDGKDRDKLFHITNGLGEGCLNEYAEIVAEKVADCIRRFVPKHLLGEWKYANELAGLSMLDALPEALIAEGVLVPPENGLGAEGCWMSVEK